MLTHHQLSIECSGGLDHIKKFLSSAKKSSSIIPKPCHSHFNPITIMPPKRKATTTAAKSTKKVIVAAAAAAAALDTDEESDVEDEDTQRVELVKVGKIK